MKDQDDFLVPSDTDLSIKCTGLNTIVLSKQCLTTFAAFSVLCCLYLLWMYFVRRTPILKRHPTELAVFKCIFDLIFFQQYLWTPALRTEAFYEDDLDHPDYYCTASEFAAFMAFLTQFSHLGGALCFLIISVDLRIAYTNPFASIRQNWPKYAAIVIITSLVSALALIAMGPRVYGVSSVGTIWIQNRRSADNVNYPKVVLYYWFLLAIYSYSVWANFQYFRFRERGLARTVSNRIDIMNRSRKLVLGYIIYDMGLLALAFASFLLDSESRSLVSFDAYGDALRGAYNLCIIIYINWSDVSSENMSPFGVTRVTSKANDLVANIAIEKLIMQPHLNSALRAEILFFATQGIIFAARESREVTGRNRDSSKQDQSMLPNFSELGRFSSRSNSTISNFNKDVDNERVTGRATVAIVNHIDSVGDSDILKKPETKQMRASLSGRIGQQQPVPTSTDKSFSFNEIPSKLDLKSRDQAPVKLSTRPGSQRISDHNVYEYESRESSMRSSMPSDASSIILRLNMEQNVAIAQEMEAALQSAAESLGADPAQVSKHVEKQRKENKENSILRQRSAGNLPDVSPTLESNRHSNFSIGNLIPRGSNRFETRNPLTASRFSRGTQSRDVEMRSTRTKSGESNSTNTTVKWRDTVDVEFGVADSNHSRTTSGNDSDFPTWQRISKSTPSISRKTTLISNDESQGQESANTSNTSINKSSTKSTVRAVLDVFNKASIALSPAQQQFRFKDFRPKLFHRIRSLVGIKHDEYARSFESTCKARFSDGRSGAFMFYSSDQKYIVKTTTKEEMADLQSILVEYMEYLEANPRTLLVRFLGAHCLTMYGVELYFVVMLNFFPRSQLSERYDLKGSWENRHGYERARFRKERRRKGIKHVPLYFDNDLQHHIALEESTTKALANQIHKDIKLLSKLNRMDYSLLVGVKRARFEVVGGSKFDNTSTEKKSEVSGEDNSVGGQSTLPKVKLVAQEQQEQNIRPNDSSHTSNPSSIQTWDTIEQQLQNEIRGIPAQYVEGPGTYYIGIIDILQGWTWKKRLEHWAKVYLQGQDGDGISAIAPVPYALRFWKRCVLDTFEGMGDDDSSTHIDNC